MFSVGYFTLISDVTFRFDYEYEIEYEYDFSNLVCVA